MSLCQGMYMGLKPSEIAALTPEIAEFTELGEYLDLPVRTYSTGMQMRLAFGMATAIRPEILLMDEWILAGDAQIMAKAQGAGGGVRAAGSDPRPRVPL